MSVAFLGFMYTNSLRLGRFDEHDHGAQAVDAAKNALVAFAHPSAARLEQLALRQHLDRAAY